MTVTLKIHNNFSKAFLHAIHAIFELVAVNVANSENNMVKIIVCGQAFKLLCELKQTLCLFEMCAQPAPTVMTVEHALDVENAALLVSVAEFREEVLFFTVALVSFILNLPPNLYCFFGQR